MPFCRDFRPLASFVAGEKAEMSAPCQRTRGRIALENHGHRRGIERSVAGNLRDQWENWRESRRQYQIERALYKLNGGRPGLSPRTTACSRARRPTTGASRHRRAMRPRRPSRAIARISGPSTCQAARGSAG
jgi:hypothetical protein